MSGERRRSDVQVMNVGDSEFALCQGEFSGEAEHVMTVDNEERMAEAPEEEICCFLEESCDDVHIKMAIDNFPQQQDLVHQTKRFKRDRRVVHVDRLQRYDEAAQDGVVLASRPRPEGDQLISRPMQSGDSLASRPRPEGDKLIRRSAQSGDSLASRPLTGRRQLN